MKFKALLLVLLILLVSACDKDEAGESAGDLLPGDLGKYDTVEGENMSDALQKAGLATLLFDPTSATAQLVLLVDRYVGCAQETGALGFRLYMDKNNPIAAGVVAIVNVDRLTSFATITNCAFGDLFSQGLTDQPQPCYATWETRKDDADYYVLYAATYPEVCSDFYNELSKNFSLDAPTE